MNKSILKMYLTSLFRDRYFILWLLLWAFISKIAMATLPNLIMLFFTFKALFKFGSSDLKMFLSFSCTRKKYYINKAKISLINSLFFSILCTILKFFGEGIPNIKDIIIIFLFYFIFYVLFGSVDILMEVLSMSQYEAVKFGLLFFSLPLYARFIIAGPIFSGSVDWILASFIPYFVVNLILTCFNIFISTITLKTTEI